MIHTRRFLIKSIIFGSSNITPVCLFLIAYFKNIGLELSTIAALMTTKKVARILFDIPFGILFDKFGAKCVFFTSKTLKILSFVLLLVSDNPTVLFVSMILNGTAYSSFYGKFNAYVFNILKENNQLKYFHKTISMFYLVGDFYSSGMGLISSYLLKYFGYNSIFYISIFVVGISNIMLFFLPTSRKIKKSKTSNIVKNVFNFFRLQPQFKYLACISGIVNFFGWQGAFLFSMVMLDVGFPAIDTAQFGIYARFFVGISAIIAYNIKKFNIMKTLNYFYVILIILTVMTLIYNKTVVYFFLSYSLVHLIFQIQIERYIDNNVDYGIRGTVTSVSWLLSTVLSLLCSMLLSFDFGKSHVEIVAKVFVIVMFITYTASMYRFKNILIYSK